MTDLEDDLQRMLRSRAGEVDPHLTGAGIRSLAAERRQHRAMARPAAGAVLAAALLITPFVLIHQGDPAPHRPAVIVPAASDTPSSKPPTRTPAPTPTVSPSLAVPTRPAVTSPSSQPSASLAPQPSSTGATAPPARPTAVPSGSVSQSGSASLSTSALPTPTR